MWQELHPLAGFAALHLHRVRDSTADVESSCDLIQERTLSDSGSHDIPKTLRPGAKLGWKLTVTAIINAHPQLSGSTQGLTHAVA